MRQLEIESGIISCNQATWWWEGVIWEIAEWVRMGPVWWLWRNLGVMIWSFTKTYTLVLKVLKVLLSFVATLIWLKSWKQDGARSLCFGMCRERLLWMQRYTSGWGGSSKRDIFIRTTSPAPPGKIPWLLAWHYAICTSTSRRETSEKGGEIKRLPFSSFANSSFRYASSCGCSISWKY